MQRGRQTKILATLGPASSGAVKIRSLFNSGVDVFRLNMSHGSHADHLGNIHAIRALETEVGRPVGILLDLQGPKLRVGTFADGPVQVSKDQPFRLDSQDIPGDQHRVRLPHPEIFKVIKPGHHLLIDDGKVKLRVEHVGQDFADTTVVVGGHLSNRKGLNVPDVALPISAMTDKDERDLAFGLEHGVDWVALSFVQTPDDIRHLQRFVGNRAAIMAKLEKPAALEHLEEIVELADGLMVARGDLGVELPPENVPAIQRRIIRECRRQGKPVVVATQMLESMTHQPTPTRAEASDVAAAVYDGVDAVMLSAETASGEFPEESVAMMDRIAHSVEADPYHRKILRTHNVRPEAPTTADAVSAGIRAIAEMLPIKVTVAYTSSGSTSLRVARERPDTPILSLSPNLETARRLTLVWGVHSLHSVDAESVEDMVHKTTLTAAAEGFTQPGTPFLMVAGMPFGTPGTTNLLRIEWA